MKKKFKDRYVLGEGYPFQDAYESIYMLKSSYNSDLDFPDELKMKFPRSIMRRDCPKYRLVLERVK